jgi:hypothetical protein
MKTITTKKIATAVMFLLLTPFLALAMIVSVRSMGVIENDVLLVLLTLSGAVLSGINGFGRRTTQALPIQEKSAGRSSHNLPWSTRPSTNA